MIGLDEVGRGCFAGPLVVAAVDLDVAIDGLRDSKKLSKKKRAELNIQILDNAESVGVAWVTASEVDRLGLAEAHRIAFKDAFSQISNVKECRIVVDGNINYLEDVTDLAEAIPRADDSVQAVMAASIVAKEARDKYMREVSVNHKMYKFDENAGYGTLAHRQAIEAHGVCVEHRLSLKPLRKYASS